VVRDRLGVPVIIIMLALGIYALSGNALPDMAPEALVVVPLLLFNAIPGLPLPTTYRR